MPFSMIQSVSRQAKRKRSAYQKIWDCPPLKRARLEILDQFLLSPEITELILRKLDTERLKYCRIVCRAWNQEICRILRQRTVAVLVDSDWAKFHKTFQQGQDLHLPRPCSNITVEAKSSKGILNPRFGSLLSLTPSMALTTLSISPQATAEVMASNENLMFNLVRNCARTLSHLKTWIWGEPFSFKIQLPALKSLTIDKFPEAHFLKEKLQVVQDLEDRFFSSILSSAQNLRHLQEDDCPRILPAILAKSELRSLQSLSIGRFSRASRFKVFLQTLREKAKIGSLRRLSIKCCSPGEIDKETFKLGIGVISRFSQTLEHLESYFEFNSRKGPQLPLCTCLKYLEIYGLSQSGFDFQNVPALQTLAISQFSVLDLAEEVVPCLSVTSVLCKFDISKIMRVQHENVESRLKLLFPPLFTLLPNARNWDLREYHYLPWFTYAVALMRDFRVEKLSLGFGQHKKKLVWKDYKRLVHLRDLKELILHKDLHMNDLKTINELQNVKTLRGYCSDPKRLIKLRKSNWLYSFEKLTIMEKYPRKTPPG